MKKCTVQPVYTGCLRLGIVRGTKRREGVKNKLDPRKYSEPTRIFSRKEQIPTVYGPVCTLLEANEPLILAVGRKSLNAHEESKDRDTMAF